MILYDPPSAAQSIPVVDLEGSFTHAQARSRVADAIHHACRETGFFYVTGHGVPEALVEAQLDWTRRFFDQDRTRKLALSIDRSPCRRGYEGYGSQVLDEGSAADFKESFMIACELAPDHPWVVAGLPMQGPNQWPDALPGFREQMSAWQDEMVRLGRHLMGCLAQSVDLPFDWFADGLGEPQCGVRLLRYPPQPADVEGNLLGAGAHSDWGSITILLQDDLGGLEVRNADGDWIPATPLGGSFVINIGQMMERFTAGIYRANLHRVRNNHAQRARHSVASFFELEPDYRMARAPTCIGDTRDDVPPPTVGEHIEDMARASYGA
ncbi:isopenicillin N synthase family dioxygenase [Novosphingobium aquimarinum]|uniref:isopenicillin N synthase family dioxygenase n=1 Tax=Novosphingobium aquimarinum TaxID=2682494 RepID=UPI0012EC45DD|nr:2-oxoglutarate and iron-dependent oxygenase domain-containing protein [Novosphingobium aquimarinum]